MSNQAILSGYKKNLEKVAATKALKIIKSLLNEGKLSEANALARKLDSRGGLKVTGPGSQLRFLGSGSEGPVHVTVGAKSSPGELTARKVLDYGGPIFSKQQAETKFNLLRRARAKQKHLGGHPRSVGSDDYATLRSKKLGKTPRGGRYYHTKYVPGGDLEQTSEAILAKTDSPFRRVFFTPETEKRLPGIQKRLESISKKNEIADVLGKSAITKNTPGWQVLDESNPGNIMIDPSGKPKIIDFLVSPRAPLRVKTPGLDRLKAYQKAAYQKTKAPAASSGDPFKQLADREAAFDRYRNIARRTTAAEWRERIPGARLTASDFDGTDFLKANPIRALRDFGPGSPRTGKLIRGAVGPGGKRVFKTPKTPYKQKAIPVKQPVAQGQAPSPSYEKMVKDLARKNMVQES